MARVSKGVLDDQRLKLDLQSTMSAINDIYTSGMDDVSSEKETVAATKTKPSGRKPTKKRQRAPSNGAPRKTSRTSQRAKPKAKPRQRARQTTIPPPPVGVVTTQTVSDKIESGVDTDVTQYLLDTIRGHSEANISMVEQLGKKVEKMNALLLDTPHKELLAIALDNLALLAGVFFATQQTASFGRDVILDVSGDARASLRKAGSARVNELIAAITSGDVLHTTGTDACVVTVTDSNAQRTYRMREPPRG